MTNLREPNNIDEDVMKLAILNAERIKEYKKLAKELDIHTTLGTINNIVRITQIKDAMKKIVARCYNIELERLYKDKISVQGVLADASKDEKWNIIFKQNTLMVCIDMVESLSMEINELLKPHIGEARISIYDNLLNLGKEAKLIREKLIRPASMDYQIDFADDAEAIQLMLETHLKTRIKKRLKDDERTE